MDMGLKTLNIILKHWSRMLADVTERAPYEACGLVAGNNNESTAVFEIPNVLNSPVRFRMSPEEQLRAFNLIDQNGWEISAIYHSHPEGPETPSKSDIAEFAYPGVIYLIWSRIDGEWRCRGFHIAEGGYEEIDLCIHEREHRI